MRPFAFPSIAGAVLVTAFGVTLAAQKTTQIHEGRGGSPHVRTEWSVHDANIAIEYGRPLLKGRADSQMMPAGAPWRTGADEATTLTTNKPLVFGSLHLAPGTYTLNTQPGPNGWQLIVGKLGKPGQWGIPYQPALEIGRAPMTLARTSAPVEQLTISDRPDARWGHASCRMGHGERTHPVHGRVDTLTVPDWRQAGFPPSTAAPRGLARRRSRIHRPGVLP